MTKEERDALRETRFPPIVYDAEYTYPEIIEGQTVTITRYRAPQAREPKAIVMNSASHLPGLVTAGLGDCIKNISASEILTTADVRNTIAPLCDFSSWNRRSK